MIEAIISAMTLWREGFTTADELISWAYRRIQEMPSPPTELLALAFDGPMACLRRPEYDYPCRPRELNFSQKFALRACLLNLKSDSSVSDFVKWLARAAMGEDLEHPEVKLGYQVEHNWDDCGDMKLAIRYVRDEVSKLLPTCRSAVDGFLVCLADIGFPNAQFPVEEA